MVEEQFTARNPDAEADPALAGTRVVDERHLCHRASMIIAVYHINNEHAKLRSNLNKDFLSWVEKCLAWQVDVMVGDGNMAANSFIHGQEIPDHSTSAIARCLESALAVVNKDMPVSKRLTVTQVDNTSVVQKYSAATYGTGDFDCVLYHVFGWGKTHLQRSDRANLQASYRDVSSAQVDPAVKPRDWQVKRIERFLHMTNRDLFLGDADKDWHNPLFITLTEYHCRNWRNRSEAKALEKKFGSAASRADNRSRGTASKRAKSDRGYYHRDHKRAATSWGHGDWKEENWNQREWEHKEWQEDT
mgnify:CR=1 FL=1